MKLFAPQRFHVGLGFSTACFFVAKSVGYGRQLILAYNFGVSRNLDIYLMTYAITMLIVSSFTLWFDQMAIPRLVHISEKDGKAAFQHMSGSVLSLAVIFGIVLTVVFLLLVGPVSELLCKGFSIDERALVRHMSWYFVPWILTIFPYNALTAILKSLRFYSVVSIADLMVSVISTTGFLFWHSRLAALPVTLSLGYIIAFSTLAFFARSHISLLVSPFHEKLSSLYHDFKQMFVVNQMVFIQQSFERFYQSYLIPGSIAAFNYVNQLMGPLYELLTFDEIFVVPISATENRVQKFERLLCGLLLLSAPMAVFLFFESEAIIRILYERGRFGPEATQVAHRILQVTACGLAIGALSTPLIRMLQISGRVLSIGWPNLTLTTAMVIFNFILIFIMKWDVLGFAIATALAQQVCVVTAFIILFHRGIRINILRLGKYLLWSLVVSMFCHLVASFLPWSGRALIGFFLRSAVYGLMLALAYWGLRARLRAIVYGHAQ